MKIVKSQTSHQTRHVQTIQFGVKPIIIFYACLSAEADVML